MTRFQLRLRPRVGKGMTTPIIALALPGLSARTGVWILSRTAIPLVRAGMRGERGNTLSASELPPDPEAL